MMMRLAVGAAIVWMGLAGAWSDVRSSTRAAEATTRDQLDRSPVDLVLTSDDQWIVTANQTSNTVSLVRVSNGQVVAELPSGKRPAALALSADGHQVLVTASYSGELRIFDLDGGSLHQRANVPLGFEPRGVAASADGKLAYVALTAANQVAVVNLETLEVESRISVGKWPRYLALTPDGSRLAVGISGDGGITVVDTQARTRLYDTTFMGLNIGQLQTSADGRYVYFPWMVYADRPITRGNIQRGWVMGNRVARVRLDEPARREALALDPRGQAVGDPHGLALSPGQDYLAISAAGTHELVVLRLKDLPLDTGGPGDHLAPQIAADSERFFRVPLGGRPMAIRFDSSGRHVYAANYLDNSVQVVNLEERRLDRTMRLGGPDEPSLARRGEAIFHDARRSVDGWYSCHSCHYEGGANAVTMDTNNDGSFGTYKMVLSLRNVTRTGPWFWHGLQDDLHAALRKSLTDTMQGPPPGDDDVRAVAAFLEAMPAPPNWQRQADGKLSPRAERGKQVFASEAAACATCHAGPYFTDGQVHDVGLGSRFDAHEGFNTPSLLGIANRVGYLHHGRAESLEELLADLHSPAKVSGTRELTKEEIADLAAYLESL